MRDIDFLMSVNESGVIVHDDAKAKINALNEWLATPKGSVWGNPMWGNRFVDFKHEPTHSNLTAINIEFSILEDIERDLAHIQITQIWCEPDKEIDKYNVTLGIAEGETTQVKV